MYYKLYIDSVFILQTVSNLYLLSLSGRVLGCTATHLRIWLGAAMGAAMLCAAVFVPAGPVWIRILISELPVSMCMLRVVYRIERSRNLIHGSLIMAGCGFCSGSIMIWILNRFRMILSDGNSMIMTLVSGYLAYCIMKGVVKGFQSRKENCIRTVSVYIPELQQNMQIQAFLDTGNHLADPVSGAPVCVVSRRLAAKMQSCFRTEKYHAIPYRSVGKESGILHAYELPELTIEEHGRKLKKEHVILAICDAGISEESVCQMILHPRLLEN